VAFRGRYELLSLGVEKNTSDDGDSRSFFQSWLDRLAPIVQSAESTGIGWVLLSLILTFACWELTLRAIGKRS